MRFSPGPARSERFEAIDYIGLESRPGLKMTVRRIGKRRAVLEALRNGGTLRAARSATASGAAAETGLLTQSEDEIARARGNSVVGEKYHSI